MPYIYLLQRKVHFGTNIYKIGKTIDIKKRLTAADYRQCKIIYIIWVNNCDKTEKDLIKIFNKEFKQCISIDPNYQGDEDYEIDDLNKAVSIIFELTKDIDLDFITDDVTNEIDKIDISKWWVNYNKEFTKEEIDNYMKIDLLLETWIKFINSWPFYYNKENQLDLQKYFEPIRFVKNGEIYFKVIRFNGTKKHYVFEGLINRNKLKQTQLQDAGIKYINFITYVSHYINKSGNKFKYYDLNNNEYETSAQEYILDQITLKLFTKQILTKQDKNKIYAIYGLQNENFINDIVNKKNILIPILHEMFIRYILIENNYNVRKIINIINENINDLEINLLIPWLIHNKVIITDDGDELELWYHDDDILLHLDDGLLSKKITDVITKIKPSILCIYD